MDPTERKIRLYRTLIKIGIALAVASLLYSLLFGASLPSVLWVPLAYAVVAWMIYIGIVQLWNRRQGPPQG